VFVICTAVSVLVVLLENCIGSAVEIFGGVGVDSVSAVCVVASVGDNAVDVSVNIDAVDVGVGVGVGIDDVGVDSVDSVGSASAVDSASADGAVFVATFVEGNDVEVYLEVVSVGADAVDVSVGINVVGINAVGIGVDAIGVDIIEVAVGSLGDSVVVAFFVEYCSSTACVAVAAIFVGVGVTNLCDAIADIWSFFCPCA
jgi:hypothetical protein